MKKVTVTIGIPAYNEGRNIQNLLRSLLVQNEEGYHIDKIVVISDGSNDATVWRAKQIKDKRLQIIDIKKRLGKSTHLNTLFSKLKSDIIVLFDADVVLAGPLTIKRLIQPLLRNNKVGLVGGNPIQIESTNVVERAAMTGHEMYKKLRLEYKQGNNILGCIGQILALSNKFAKQVKVPPEIMCNDSFLYLSCVSLGFRFVHVPKSNVLYRAPKTSEDHFKQIERFVVAKKRLLKLFGKMAENEYKIPNHLYYKHLIITLITKPLTFFNLALFNTYSRYLAIRNASKLDSVWPIAWSTKKGIKVYL